MSVVSFGPATISAPWIGRGPGADSTPIVVGSMGHDGVADTSPGAVNGGDGESLRRVVMFRTSVPRPSVERLRRIVQGPDDRLRSRKWRSGDGFAILTVQVGGTIARRSGPATERARLGRKARVHNARYPRGDRISVSPSASDDNASPGAERIPKEHASQDQDQQSQRTDHYEQDQGKKDE
jgi:hypothetical protein